MKKVLFLFLLVFACLFVTTVKASPMPEYDVLSPKHSAAKTLIDEKGNLRSYLYEEDVFFMNEEGEYEEIDNSLKSTLFSGYHTTQHSDYVVKLPRSINEKMSVSVSFMNSSFSITYLGISRSKGEITNSVGPKFAENTASRIHYKDIFDDTDLVFDIRSSQLKETLVLKSHQDGFSIKYLLKLDNLELTEKEDGLFQLENEDGDCVFEIEPFYMYDQQGLYSYEIAVLYQKVSDSEYLFTITPSASWLKNESIKYPVEIDPTVTYTMNSASNFIQDKYCMVGSDYCVNNNRLNVMYDETMIIDDDYDYTLMFSVLNLNTYNIYDFVYDEHENYPGYTIDSIKVYITRRSTSMYSSSVFVQEISNTPVSYTSLNGNSNYVVSYQTSVAVGSTISFDITGEVYKKKKAEIVSLRYRLYPKYVPTRNNVSFYSSESSSSPILEVTYGNWYTPEASANMNCYGFALGIDQAPNPNGIGSPYTSATAILNNVIVDLNNWGIDYRVLDAFNSTIYSNEYRIGMRVLYDPRDGNPYSYHFIRQLPNGFWAQKLPSKDSWVLCAGSVDPLDTIWLLRDYPGIPIYDACIGDAIYLAIQIDD